ncbi:MAG: hypothetical protein HON23_05525 [Rickettsiales bacterium]|nr:hypothetical protein [Rickettsiales bacterium]
MGHSKAAHALRSAEDLPLGQILIPNHKNGIWYYRWIARIIFTRCLWL